MMIRSLITDLIRLKQMKITWTWCQAISEGKQNGNSVLFSGQSWSSDAILGRWRLLTAVVCAKHLICASVKFSMLQKVTDGKQERQLKFSDMIMEEKLNIAAVV